MKTIEVFSLFFSICLVLIFVLGMYGVTKVEIVDRSYDVFYDIVEDMGGTQEDIDKYKIELFEDSIFYNFGNIIVFVGLIIIFVITFYEALTKPQMNLKEIFFNSIFGIGFDLFFLSVIGIKIIEFLSEDFLFVIFDNLFEEFIMFYFLYEYWFYIILIWGICYILLNIFQERIPKDFISIKELIINFKEDIKNTFKKEE